MNPPKSHRLSHERKLTWLTLVGCSAIVVALLFFVFAITARSALYANDLIALAFGFHSSSREHISSLANMSICSALREGVYSLRARGASEDNALGEVLLEINSLGETLRLQRLGAFEATALLRTIMGEIDVAIFTFDPERRLRLVNRAGETLLGQPMDKLLGKSAKELGLDPVTMSTRTSRYHSFRRSVRWGHSSQNVSRKGSRTTGLC